MTREEALEVFSTVKERSEHFKECGCRFPLWTITERDDEAIDMAIEALRREEAEEKGYCHRIRPKNVEVVVRCKDCKHYIVEGITTRYGWCHEYKHSVDEDDYCSYGERREP